MMATSMNPVGLYHDPSLDGLIAQARPRARSNGHGAHPREGSSPPKQSISESFSPTEHLPPVAPEVPRGPPISYRGLGPAENGVHRSFSQRARGLQYHKVILDDVEDDGDHHDDDDDDDDEIVPPRARVPVAQPRADPAPVVARKPVGTDGLRVNTTNLGGPVATKPPRREIQSAREASFDPHQAVQRPRRTSDVSRRPDEPVSAVNRSSAMREESRRRDWAPDRSPLQKLEVTLNDISKEEKRARVQEAEMLLRERETQAARTPVDAPRAVSASTAVPAAKRESSTRETQPRTRTRTRPQPDALEDAGLVRNLSTTHRQRLQHSTTIDSHRPDARTLSGEGPAGFEYTISNRPSRARGPSDKYRGEDVMDDKPDTRARPDKSVRISAQPANIELRKRPERALTDPSLSAPAGAVAPSGGIRREVTERQRNASHKAALEKLTGESPPVAGARAGSRKLQKALPALPDEGAASSRKESMSRGPESVPASALTPGQPRSDRELGNSSIGRTPQSFARPQTPPMGFGLQSSPQASSPMSPPKVTDPTRQRQRKSSVSFKEPVNRRPVDEWKEAGVARLASDDFAAEPIASMDKKQPWWDKPAASSTRRRSASSRTADQSARDAPVDDATAEFRPRLYLRCGPLLRYTGMKRLKSDSIDDREIWRGSVLIVTQDSHSSYDPPPTLRLFSRPRTLLPPPPHHVTGDDLRPEYVDPIAGLPKISRTGRTLYVRPVDHLEEGRDLSQIENDDGLFESSPSPPDLGASQASVDHASRRNPGVDGERLGRFQEVRGARLYADPDRDVTFWRFNLEIELGAEQQHVAYRINRGASMAFWVPARGQTMNIMFHSCNGFSASVNPDHFSGPDPMWRDVLNTHQTLPFHVMIGGGDQIYNDRVMLETQHFSDWTKIRNPQHKHHAPFTNEMKEELETFYLNRYAMWFSQGLFGLAVSQIPMVNIWDDHDIIDGFGSYPHHFMETPVFSGLGNVAFKYYMLFQHQSVPEETTQHEPSWVLGHQPGPYIKQLSRSLFMHLGKHVAFLGLDCRTERMRDEVLSVDTIELVLERCRRELVEGETKHLIILLGVPIAYPRLVWLENVLTSRLMDPVKALGRAGILKGGFLNKFDGGVEILDDLDDHWTATNHKHERNDLVKDLQDLAAEKSCRVTILGGDVHLAAIGQFYSNPKLKIPKDRDHRYMPNVISSAIVNTPPSDMLADILNKRNKTHHLDRYTDENMIPMFTHDVDGRKRNNRHMLPRRNWCSIREYVPGSTPPPSLSESPAMSEAEEDDDPDARPRRFSLSRDDINPRNLIRRLSSKNAPPSSYRDMMYDQGRSASHDGTTRPGAPPFPAGRDASGSQQPSLDLQAPPQRRASSFDHNSSGVPLRPSLFPRRPTNLSEKAAKKGNVPALDAEGNEIDVNDQVNLAGGLDVVLNVEVNQKDPSGITVPFRLLVPALWYDGSSDREKLDEVSMVPKRSTILNRFSLGGRRAHHPPPGPEAEGDAIESDDESDSDQEDVQRAPRRIRRFSLFGSRRQRKEEVHSDSESGGDEPVPPAAVRQPPRPWEQRGTVPPPPTIPPAVASSNRMMPVAHRPPHDQLYDTDNRPPVGHSLEPSHPSVRRALTISSTDDSSAPGPRSHGLQDINDSYPIQHPPPPRRFASGPPDRRDRGQAGYDDDYHAAVRRLSGSEVPQRRLSKQERILGISATATRPQAPPQQLRGSGIIGKDYDPPFPPAVQQYSGYSGIEAYKDPKPRRAFSLKKARGWLDGRS